MNRVGLIAIGRNEGERLQQCLISAIAQVSHVVYVDSGSTDHSLDIAQSLDVKVVSLDLSIPFTAARARNAGFEKLLKLAPTLEYIQFIDGDCELVQGWIERALKMLDEQPSIAVVCGRRRERYPDASIYNKLCDLEWDTPIGEALACGGDALIRVAAFNQVHGFNPALIAGEEPELCVRLRQKGWKIFRIDADMTIHDAQMHSIRQWWRRFQRAGHAYAEGAWLHGQLPERHWVKESYSIWVWGLAIPVVSISLIFHTRGLSLLLLSLYPLCIYKVYRHGQRHGLKRGDAALYAISCVLGKFPGTQGQLIFHWNRLAGRSKQLIEYK